MSIMSEQIGREVWRLIKFASRPFGRRRAFLLSLGGPLVLSVLLLVWASTLTLSAGLIIHPKLGASVTRASGQTSTDFVAALYAVGYDHVISVEHEDRRFEGDLDLVKRGFLIARETLRPLIA